MRRAFEALLAVLIAALALPTAVVGAVPPPPAPSAVEIAEFAQASADETWRAFPLSESMDQPTIEFAEPLGEEEWDAAFAECIEDSEKVDTDSGADSGVVFAGGSERAIDELNFYRCLVVHPRDYGYPSVSSAARMDYSYRYFARWLVPCLLGRGYRVDDPPTYAEFVALRGSWSPHNTRLTGPDGDMVTSIGEYDRLMQLCGNDFVGF